VYVCECDESKTQRRERGETVQRNPALGERITGGLVLKAIDSELLAEPAPVAHGVRGEEGLADVDALVSHHGGEKRHHCIFDVLRGQNTCIQNIYKLVNV